MMKKRLAVLLMAAMMVGSLTACGDSKKEYTLEELEEMSDEELEEVLQERAEELEEMSEEELEEEFQERAEALDEEFEREEAEEEAAEEKANEEAIAKIKDYGVADIDVENVNPYETNIFEVMGLDKNFPAPEKLEHTWNYETWKSESTKRDSKTGDIVENPHTMQLILDPDGAIYEDYLTELDEYLIQRSDVQSDQNWDMTKKYWMKTGMQIVVNEKEPSVGGVSVTVYPTKPVHFEGIVTRANKDYKYILNENGEPVEIPYPESFTVEMDNVVDGIGAFENKISVSQIYSYDEKGYAIEPKVDYVNAETLQEGSRVIVDTVIADNPYHRFLPGVLSVGDDIGKTTVQVVE